jgi:pimeloyl-ACP methyl ester carboxylesterase
MRTHDVSFYADGEPIAATFYQPDIDGPTPAIVYCQGFGGTREYVAPDLAQRLTRSGYAVLAFDHRGFGDSGGRRHRIEPNEQIEDVRSAVMYLSTRPDVIPTSIGLLGVSFGGAMAIAAAAQEPLVRSTVACVPFSDGRAWMKSIRRYWEWIEFEERLEADRRRAVLTGVSEEVDPDEILIRDPESHEWSNWLKENYPSRTGFRLQLASARSILEFRPIDVVHKVSRLLVVTVDHDTLIPIEQAEALYERAPQPKGWYAVRHATHHAIYRDPTINELTDVVGDWFRCLTEESA